MFEQVFKNIDDVLRKEAGCTTELDYTEQTSWLLFLKYLEALEQERAMEAELQRKKYAFLLDKPYRWETWAAPKLPGNANLPIGAAKSSSIDHNKALSGDDLKDFVNLKLFPYLQGFKARASGPNTIEYKIGEIFGEIKNKIQSGYNLREIIDHIDELRFRSQTEKHELSHLYEAKIKNMGNAGRNGGEYYTSRPSFARSSRSSSPASASASMTAPVAPPASSASPSSTSKLPGTPISRLARQSRNQTTPIRRLALPDS
ncbi:MAG: type I restriction-modification system subunit M N-terminal domain-containing protein, partial [Candidatus Acidiferrum sp.]